MESYLPKKTLDFIAQNYIETTDIEPGNEYGFYDTFERQFYEKVRVVKEVPDDLLHLQIVVDLPHQSRYTRNTIIDPTKMRFFTKRDAPIESRERFKAYFRKYKGKAYKKN